MRARVLAGPQRPVLNLRDAVDAAAIPEGPVAVIAAGWQEAENDIDDVVAAAGREVVNLSLYRRAEETFAAAPELLRAYRSRQDRLQDLQRLYRLRLQQTIAAARQMLRASGEKALVGPEQRHAIAQLRTLDRHHLRRVQALHEQFDAAFGGGKHPLLERQRTEIATQLAAVSAVILTGGNVAVLLNRLRLFDLGALLGEKHLVAWSAGAMALTDRIVLFHDNPPQGRRNPELFGAGLGLVPGLVLLPDARRRLRVKDRIRMALFSRRFAPATCVTLDNGDVLHLEAARPTHASGVRHITAGGRLRRWRAA